MKIKKSYIILTIFYLCLILLLLVNSFIKNYLTGNGILLFVLFSLIIFKFLLGIEKDRHRYTKDMFIEILIFMLIFFLMFYLFGVLINNFYRNDNYLTYYGIKMFIMPIIIKIILMEILRYATIKKSENSKILLVLNFILFFLIDTTNYYNIVFNSKYSIFLIVAMNILPMITKNIVGSLMSLKLGYKPFILYLLIFEIYPYVLPIIPNCGNYILSIINFLMPILLYVRINKFLKKTDDEDELSRDNKKGYIFSYASLALFVIITVYLTSGYFKYTLFAIASGSMSPVIHKGDAVIAERIDDESVLEEGVIIAFINDGVVIVHRLIRKVKVDNTYYYYTQGDANNTEDGIPISIENIVGIVRVKFPYIGLPTVWTNEIRR